MSLSAVLAGHLARVEQAMKTARDGLREAASIARLENIAAVDLEALETFARVTDATQGGVERMAERVKRARSDRA